MVLWILPQKGRFEKSKIYLGSTGSFMLTQSSATPVTSVPKGHGSNFLKDRPLNALLRSLFSSLFMLKALSLELSFVLSLGLPLLFLY